MATTILERKRSVRHSTASMQVDVVLAKVDGAVQPYVTWLTIRNPKDPERYWGHYFCSLDEALEDFNTRN